MNEKGEKKVIDNFITRMDPSKLYLTRKQENAIRKDLKGIFKNTEKSNCEPIIKAYKKFAQYYDARIEFIKKTLKSPKFRVNKKTFVPKGERKKRYRSIAKAQSAHQKLLQFEVAQLQSTDVSFNKAKEVVKKRYMRNYRKVQVRAQSREKILIEYMKAFAFSLDPHSDYLSRDDWNSLQEGLQLSIEGIGAFLSFDEITGMTVVRSLVKGGAAIRGGLLKEKDKIIAVAQEPKKREKLKYEDVIGMELSEVVKKIKGPKNTDVYLRVLRKKGKGNIKLEFKIKRAKIQIESGRPEMVYRYRTIKGKKRKIALINLPSFYGDKKTGLSATEDIKKELQKASKEGVSGVVLDLTGNSGGILHEAVSIAGLFFKKGNVVKQSRSPVLKDRDKNTYFSGPLVVLVNQNSASASEIVAGSLKDYKRAVVVGGKHTFGKGTVQSIQLIPKPSPLRAPDVIGAARLTVGMYFTPSGFSTQNIGVKAHIVFPNYLDEAKHLERDYPNALKPEVTTPFLSQDQINDGSWIPITEKLVSYLKRRSQIRIKKSKKFKKIVATLKKDKIREEKEKTLSIEAFLRDSSEEKEKQKENKKLSYKQLQEKDKKLYLERADIEEAINIVADMIGYYRQNKLFSSGK